MHLAISVPLADLALDEVANVRKTGRGSEPHFVASIRAKGIIVPLTVRGNGAGYKVVDGGKRLDALKWMQAHGEIAGGVRVDAGYPVPVTVRDEDDREARDTSLITNIVVAGMHPVDEFEAFAALADDGWTAADIAARYALTDRQVRQRLALGALAPKVRDAWRAGEIGTDQAKVFTLAPTIKDQERVLDKLKKSGDLRFGTHRIKEAFVGKQGDTGRLVAFVGADELRQAGVDLREDLFGTAHTVPDPKVLRKLADQKLAAECERLTGIGWGWAAPKEDLPHGAEWSWSKVSPKKAKPTKAEAARTSELQATLSSAEKADEEDDEALETAHAASAEIDAIEAAIAARSYLAKDMARAGCIVSIGHNGELEVKLGVLKPDEAKKDKARERAKEKAKAKNAADAPGDAEAEGPAISNALAHDLSVAMTLAVREALQAERPIAFAGLLAGFVSADHYDPVRVKHEGFGYQMHHGGEDYAAAFARFATMTIDELLVVAAGVAGEAVSLELHHGGQAPMADPGVAALVNAIDAERLATALRSKFDPADFFKRASARVAIDALAEMAIDKGKAKKKPELAALAATGAVEKSWLPAELRTAHYAGPGAPWSPATNG